MIPWLTVVLVSLATVVGLVVVIAGLAGRVPDDYSLGATALVELGLIVLLVVVLLAPAFGNLPTGNGLEFWTYLVSAVLLPPAAAVWALLDRTRWSTVVLGAASLAIAVMVYRMDRIWFVQVG